MKSLSDTLPKTKFHLQPRFTTILHPVRIEMGLSVNEYVIIDGIDQTSHRPDHPWCTISKDAMADWTGFSRRTVFRAIERGLQLELVEKNERGDLRSTTKWINAVRLYKAKTSIASK